MFDADRICREQIRKIIYEPAFRLGVFIIHFRLVTHCFKMVLLSPLQRILCIRIGERETAAHTFKRAKAILGYDGLRYLTGTVADRHSEETQETLENAYSFYSEIISRKPLGRLVLTHAARNHAVTDTTV